MNPRHRDLSLEAARRVLELDPTNALARHGLTQALLGRAWWYRPFFQLQPWSARYGNPAALALMIGLRFVVSAKTAAFSGTPALVPAGTTRTRVTFGFCISA